MNSPLANNKLVNQTLLNKKLLITGASGYLAKTLLPCAARRANVVGIARRIDAISNATLALAVDLTDRVAVMDVVLSQKPDAIIHCAAVNPGGSDSAMDAVNNVGTSNIAQAARQLGCRLVSVSSDTVFNGMEAPYPDNAAASPPKENVYATTKACGEAHIRNLLPEAIIVRTSLIYGTDEIDRGTAGFAKRLAQGETLKLFTDVIRQPVHNKALATSLCALALDHTSESGFINIAGDEPMSRFDFGVRMLNYWGINYADQLEQISGAGIPGVVLDASMLMHRAKALGLATPGVSAVLGSVSTGPEIAPS